MRDDWDSLAYAAADNRMHLYIVFWFPLLLAAATELWMVMQRELLSAEQQGLLGSMLWCC